MSQEIPELAHDVPEEVRDGIGEEDNPIPLWFNASWIATWVFALLYIAWYLVGSDWSSKGQYALEMEKAEAIRAEARANLPTENPYRGDAAAIAAGKITFETTCAACHLPTGQGLVGPSLVDPYWKYGHSDDVLFETVSQGRPGGMPPWEAQLGAKRIWQVLAYVETLPKSDVPGVGAPGYQPPTP